MRILIFILSCILILPPKSSFGQARFSTTKSTIKKSADLSMRTCHTVEMDQRLQQMFPEQHDRQTFETRLQEAIKSKKAMRTSAVEQVYRIPVIVHIVHNGEAIGTGSNISQAQVMSQFDALNDDFRRLGRGYNDHVDGADVLIEFVPATRNPDGLLLSEQGIDRINGNRSFWEEIDIEDILKPGSFWDPDRYFNIWVTTFGGDLDGVLGYAQFPSQSGLAGLRNNEGLATTDGVIIDHESFGTTGSVRAPYNLGRTTTHEVGHWLGLIHIWGDGDCSMDDYCTDTPPADGPNSSCVFRDSCPSDSKPDMIENYMDYTSDGCMNIFTNDQKMRMRTVMEISPRRNSLLQSMCANAEKVDTEMVTTEAAGWYVYTAKSAGVLTISSVGLTTVDTYLEVKRSCEASTIASSDNAFGTAQSEIDLLVSTGEEIYFYWSDITGAQTFDWSVKESTAYAGNVCDSAVVAVMGENQIPISNLNSFWFVYEAPDTVTKLTIQPSHVSFTAYTGSCGSFSKLYEGKGASTFSGFEAASTIYLRFDVADSTQQWILIPEKQAIGAACIVAATASLGTNSFQQAPYWYRYAMSENGTLNISNVGLTSVHSYAEVYDACGGNILSDNVSLNGQTQISIDLTVGQEIFILWDSVHSKDGFEWAMSITPVPPGQSCVAPVELTLGNHSVPNVSLDEYWYRFVIPADNKKYVITSQADEYVVVVPTDCSSDAFYYAGYQNMVITEFYAGDTAMIYWETLNGGGFNWTIEELDLAAGDHCADPLVAAEGLNNSTGAPAWYTFNMPAYGDLLVSSVGKTEEDTYLEIYDACDGELIKENDDFGTAFQSYVIMRDMVPDEQVLIHWLQAYSSEAFDWSLAVRKAPLGKFCELPDTAVIGVNDVPSSLIDYYFTVFEVPDDNKTIQISSTSATSVYALTGCDFNVFDTGFENMTLINLPKGMKVLMAWEAASYPYAFTLSVEDTQHGTLCELPKSAQLGSNRTNELEEWFEYIMPKSGDLNINYTIDIGDIKYAEIYHECNGTLVAQTTDIFAGNKNLELPSLNKGDTVLIKWTTNNLLEGFNWDISIKNIVNGVPRMSDQVFEVKAADVQSGLMIGKVQAIDSDLDRLFYYIHSGNDAEIFTFNTSTGELYWNFISLWDTQPITLYVSVSDGFATTFANITVQLFREKVNASWQADLSIYPNPSDDVIHISHPAEHPIMQVVISDLSGKIILKKVGDQFSMDVSTIAEGLYMLSLTFEDGSEVISKICISR